MRGFLDEILSGPDALVAGYGRLLVAGRVGLLGGEGIVEAATATVYHGLGVPDAICVVVIIAYRLLSFWITTLLSVPLALMLNRGSGLSDLTESEASARQKPCFDRTASEEGTAHATLRATHASVWEFVVIAIGSWRHFAEYQ